MTLADRLRALIEASGMSQAAFAEHRLRRSPRTLRYWLAGGKIQNKYDRQWIEAQYAALDKPASSDSVNP